MQFHYVYNILRSTSFPDRFYVGLTENLSLRLEKHNTGQVPHTSKFGPWQVKTAVAFRDKAQAVAFCFDRTSFQDCLRYGLTERRIPVSFLRENHDRHTGSLV